MWFTKVSINHPVFATMMMAAICVLGLFSYQRLSVEEMPDITIPVAWVYTPYPGASAEAVELEITKPLEEVVNTVAGVKVIRSNSREGSSVVVVEFELSADIKTAVQDVRDKVAQVRGRFNKDVGEPTVSRADNGNDQAIVSLSMQSTSRSLRELSDLADRLVVKRIQGAPGVGNIEVSGDVGRVLAIELKPGQMAALGVGVAEIVAAIRVENQDQPAGALIGSTSERLVRVLAKIKTVQDFERIIVARRGSAGATTAITLGQVATVTDGEREATSIATINGKRGIGIEIRKTRGSNTIEMADAIRKQIDELKKTLPADISLEVTNDRSVGIKDNIRNVKHTIVEGALLTVLIVFLFLHSWRSTVITGLTLPISVFGAFIALYAFGFTLNFLTLLALSLSIGILIDDAIVVRENIVRHIKMGKSHRQAAFEATQEIGVAVMATTFTIIAVFLPVAFMGGIIGKFFYQFGITVVVAVLVSLFVSFTLDPMLSSIWHDKPSKWMNWWPIRKTLEAQDRMMTWLHVKYDDALRWSLDPTERVLPIPTVTFIDFIASGFKDSQLRFKRLHIRNRALVLLASLAIFIGSFFLTPFIGSDFVPETDNNDTGLQIRTPIGSSLAYTNSKAEQVEAALREYPEVLKVNKYVGKIQAWINIDLVPKENRKLSKKELDDKFRERLQRIAGLEVTVGWNRPIRLFILGPDVNELDRISKQVQAKMKDIKGMVDIDTSYKPTSPTLDITVNRALASDLGVSLNQIGSTTRAMIAGEQAGQWAGPDGENHEILVRLPRDERTGTGDLDKLFVPGRGMNSDGMPMMVPLRQVADFKPAFAERQIERRNLQRQIQLSAGVASGSNTGDVANAFQDILKGIELPPGYSFQQGGQSADMKDSFGFFLIALAMGVIFIYFILASQFGSFLHPFAIMASLPLSLVGVLLALLFWGSTLNLFSAIGFLMLMGLVTKNAILLVDFTNQRRREGQNREDAILEAGQVRLRPIMMTTTAMIFGMVPLALAFGAGSEQQSPMAHAVIGGIITSTVFTLVVVPVIYTYVDTWGTKFTAWFTRNDDKHALEGTAVVAQPSGGAGLEGKPAQERGEV